MKRSILILGALALIGSGVVAAAQARGWVPLYNGRDLSGWHAKDGKPEAWHTEGNLLVCQGAGGGWLTSDRQYGDFELRLDYRIPKGGNSGVGIRYPAQGDPAHEGMEIQILDDS